MVSCFCSLPVFVALLFTTCVLLGSFVINILFAFYRSKKKKIKMSLTLEFQQDHQ